MRLFKETSLEIRLMVMDLKEYYLIMLTQYNGWLSFLNINCSYFRSETLGVLVECGKEHLVMNLMFGISIQVLKSNLNLREATMANGG